MLAFHVMSGIGALGEGTAAPFTLHARQDSTKERAECAKVDRMDLVGGQATAADGDLSGEMAIFCHVQGHRPKSPVAQRGCDVPKALQMLRHRRAVFTVLQQDAPPRVPKR